MANSGLYRSNRQSMIAGVRAVLLNDLLECKFITHYFR